MKNRSLWIIVGLCVVALACAILVGGCSNPAQIAAYDDLVATYERIVADGTITPAERAQLEMKAREYGDTLKDTDLPELLITGGTTFLLSLFGVNAYRNRSLPGAVRKS